MKHRFLKLVLFSVILLNTSTVVYSKDLKVSKGDTIYVLPVQSLIRHYHTTKQWEPDTATAVAQSDFIRKRTLKGLRNKYHFIVDSSFNMQYLEATKNIDSLFTLAEDGNASALIEMYKPLFSQSNMRYQLLIVQLSSYIDNKPYNQLRPTVSVYYSDIITFGKTKKWNLFFSL